MNSSVKIVQPSGVLGNEQASKLRQEISEVVGSGAKLILVDLQGVTFIDSSGLGALVQLAKQAQTAEGTSQIVTNARVTQTVKLVRLEKFLSLQPSMEAALENVK